MRSFRIADIRQTWNIALFGDTTSRPPPPPPPPPPKMLVTNDETIVKKPMRSIPIPPPPRPKMLVTIPVRMKNGKIILRKDEINTIENTVKPKPVGNNIKSSLKDRSGALARQRGGALTLRPSNALATISPQILFTRDLSGAVSEQAVTQKAESAVKSLESTAIGRRGGGGGKAALIGLGLVAGVGGIGYLASRKSN